MAPHPRTRHPTIPVIYASNAAERIAQADRVMVRAIKQQDRRKAATPGSARRRKGDR